MRWLGLLVVMVGCSTGTFEPKPGQDQVVALVWAQMYGETDDAPAIEWVNSDSLWSDNVGFTYAGWKIMLAAVDEHICGTDRTCGPIYRFSSTSLAHELMHYRTWKRTGDVDPFHFRGDWDLAHRANHDLFIRGM